MGDKIKKENHHVIPFSLYWIDNEYNNNIINILKEDHKKIHEWQNIKYHHIREYKKKTNWILVPNDYVIDWRVDLRRRYFSNVSTCIFEQKNSLAQQINRYNLEIWSREIVESNQSFEDLVLQIWEKQKEIIKIIINK